MDFKIKVNTLEFNKSLNGIDEKIEDILYNCKITACKT